MSTLETKLTAVTVYPDRARLTRAGTFSLEAGKHTLEIPGLPDLIEIDSLRGKAYGTARSRLLGVQARRVYFSETPVEQVRQLEGQIEGLGDQIEALLAKKDLIGSQRLSLDALTNNSKVFARALSKGTLSLEAHLALIDGLRARTQGLEDELRALALEKRALERRREQLAAQLKPLEMRTEKQQLNALVEVDVLQAGDLTVELTYLTRNCGWKPLYDMRLQEDGDRPMLEMTYLAQVSQQTGEAWQNVALTLSTARPALPGLVEELKPWYIQPLSPPIPAPQVRSAMMAASFDAQAREAEPLLGAPMPAAPVEVAAARVDSSGAAVSYHVAAPASIPADGLPHNVTVAQINLQPDLDYVSTPKLIEAVYRRAKVVNASELLFLAGKANLFAGDEFIGTARLDLTAPGGEIELFLGVDDRLKIERKLVRREVGKNLIGGKRRMAYGYQIEIENLLSKPAKVNLHDQLPLSKHEDIKVRLDAIDPKPLEQDELNLLTWEFTLAPHEKQLLRFDFTVEAPQDLPVIGLP